MAAQWMAARDRGFTPAEQDAYLQWLSEDPAHGAEIARLARAWDRLDVLHQWNPTHSARPNADLLQPRPRRPFWRRQPLVMAAAAALVLAAGLFWLRPPASSENTSVIMHPGPRRLTLEDGSRVELNTDARIDVHFTAEKRAVTLLQGEAHFVVAKNPHRPFVVTAGDYTVRAVGTAFNVALAPSAVSVLVTEGEVQLNAPAQTADTPPFPHLFAGQQAQLDAELTNGVRITELTPAEMEAALAWQSFRLEFHALPLREVVAEFNRYNHRQLVVGDSATGDIMIGGTFRADNVEAFVRLLDVGFGIQAQNDGDRIMLLQQP